MALELKKDRWYAMEVLSDFFADLNWEIRHRVPIQVLRHAEGAKEHRESFNLGFLELF